MRRLAACNSTTDVHRCSCLFTPYFPPSRKSPAFLTLRTNDSRSPRSLLEKWITSEITVQLCFLYHPSSRFSTSSFQGSYSYLLEETPPRSLPPLIQLPAIKPWRFLNRMQLHRPTCRLTEKIAGDCLRTSVETRWALTRGGFKELNEFTR